MKTRIIHTKIHLEDDWFNTLPIGYRYLYIYLFTNSHIGLTGIYQISERVVLLETGATEKEWKDASGKFETDGKVNFFGNWVYMKNSAKYSNYTGPKNEEAYKKELALLPQEVVAKLGYSIDTVSYSIDTTINHKYKIINQKSEIINQGKGIEVLRERVKKIR